MAARRPLVHAGDGTAAELSDGDTLIGLGLTGRTIDDDSTTDDLVLRVDDDIVYVTSTAGLTITVAAMADVPYELNKPIDVLNVGGSGAATVTIASTSTGILKGNGVNSSGSVDEVLLPVGGALSLIPRETDSWRVVGNRSTSTGAVSTVFIGALAADFAIPTTGTLTPVVVDSLFDPGDAFDGGTGALTLLEDGWYEMSFGVTLSDGTTPNIYAVGVVWTATNSVSWDSYPSTTHTTRHFDYQYLLAGDTLTPLFYAASRTTTVLAGAKFVVKKM